MSTPLEYCPSLFYLHRVSTWHGLYFGNFSHGIRWDRLTRLDYALITLQIILGVTFFYKMVDAFVSGAVLPVDLNGNGEMKDMLALTGDLKPGSYCILKLTFTMFFVARLNLQSVLLYKGTKIFETMNNRYFHHFDVKTGFHIRMKIVVELMIVFFESISLASFWIPFGVAFDLQSIILAITVFIDIRHIMFAFFLQFFVFQASGFCLEHLQAQASSRLLCSNECLRCTREVERILHHFTSFYRHITSIILTDFVGFLAFCLFQGIFFFIRDPPAELFLMLRGNFVWFGMNYLALFYQQYCVKSRFTNLCSILSKRSPRLSIVSQAKQADLVVRVHLLGLDVDRETPPTLCGLLSFHHATIINITIFMVETSIVLYQTEYM